jgi:hypothetical protein
MISEQYVRVNREILYLFIHSFTHLSNSDKEDLEHTGLHNRCLAGRDREGALGVLWSSGKGRRTEEVQWGVVRATVSNTGNTTYQLFMEEGTLVLEVERVIGGWRSRGTREIFSM